LTYRLRGERYHGVFAETLEHEVAKRWLDEAHGWFDDPQLERPRAERTRSALVETPFGLGVAHEVAESRIAYRRRRRAMRAFTDTLHLGAAGVPTPQAYAALLPRRRGDPAALVLEQLEAPTLGAWIAAGAEVPGGDRTALAHAIADTLARLHRSGLRHRALGERTLRIEPEVPGIVVVGLDGIHRKRLGISRRGWRCRARDLASLHATLTDRSTPALDLERELWRPLLARYCAGTGDDPDELDAWTRRRIR
jgi:tRNA A-37 threonylcarbamoyl transferase component Bud32